jgi:hypothetical protein
VLQSTRVWWGAALVAVAIAAGAFALGRASVDTDAAREEGRAAGRAEGRAAGRAEGLAAGRAVGPAEGRAAGIREGRAVGIREGRALQVAAGSRRAFQAGYTAGANDVFGGFDGGWSLGTPYLITLGRGARGVTYRIDARRPAGQRREQH